MTFILGLVAVSIVSFLPQYLLNFREKPNPFQFLRPSRMSQLGGIKLLYTKVPFTDPFRVQFDYVLLVSIVAYFDWRSKTVTLLLATILVFGFIEIVYSSVMQTIFKRPPSIGSDLRLLKTGLTIAREKVAALAALAVALIAGLGAIAFIVTEDILDVAPIGNPAGLILAGLLLFPCLYNWTRYPYGRFVYRTVYSPFLHTIRNITYGRRYEPLMRRDKEYFRSLNPFSGVEFRQPPSVVTLCVESYGSVALQDPQLAAVCLPVLDELQKRLDAREMSVASAYSRSPIFSGGSWLSYATFAYGTRIDDLNLYEGLFRSDCAFESYESIFHIFKRNGYTNFLLCPLGGVDADEVDWRSIDRCFHSDWNIDFEGLDYSGNTIGFLSQTRRYFAPDEFALNRAYEIARQESPGAFSLFFLTLNSHYPYKSPLHSTGDWRSLNDASYTYKTTKDLGADLRVRYGLSIKYQLEVIGDFVEETSDDELLYIIFGDHQPPLVATDGVGTYTPVHIVSKDRRIIDSLVKDGFSPSFVPDSPESYAVNHEGLLSLIMRAMNAAYGKHPDARPPLLPEGTRL